MKQIKYLSIIVLLAIVLLQAACNSGGIKYNYDISNGAQDVGEINKDIIEYAFYESRLYAGSHNNDIWSAELIQTSDELEEYVNSTDKRINNTNNIFIDENSEEDYYSAREKVLAKYNDEYFEKKSLLKVIFLGGEYEYKIKDMTIENEELKVNIKEKHTPSPVIAIGYSYILIADIEKETLPDIGNIKVSAQIVS